MTNAVLFHIFVFNNLFKYFILAGIVLFLVSGVLEEAATVHYLSGIASVH